MHVMRLNLAGCTPDDLQITANFQSHTCIIWGPRKLRSTSRMYLAQGGPASQRSPKAAPCPVQPVHSIPCGARQYKEQGVQMMSLPPQAEHLRISPY